MDWHSETKLNEMIRNYLKFAARNLLKNKTFIINNGPAHVIKSAVATSVDSFKYEYDLTTIK